MDCVLIGNGIINNYAFYSRYFNSKPYVICCDGGMYHAEKLGIIPNLILGDFDSSDNEIKDYFESYNVKFLSFNSEKDETDMEIGILEAIKMNPNKITIIGGMGGRLDHTLANCGLLKLALDNGIKSELVDEKNTVALTDKNITVKGKKGQLVSLIPMTSVVKGVTTTGLKYPLKNEDLEIQRSRGVSNVMDSDEAGVSVKSGLLYVILSKD